MSKNRIRMTIVALAAGTFGLVAVAGPTQALAETGSGQLSQQVTVTADTTLSLSTSLTLPIVSPDDSCWD